MIIDIVIEKFEFFEKTTLTMQQGLSTITGASGAGKSMLLKTIGFLMCQKNQGPKQQDAEVSIWLEKKDWPSLLHHLSNEEQKKINTDTPPKLTRCQNAAGRSKQSLNGLSINQKTMQNMLEPFIFLNHQHAHHHFTDQKHLLDYLDQHIDEQYIQNTQNAFEKHREALKEYEYIQEQIKNSPSSEELEEIISDATEADIFNCNLEELDQEHKRLQNHDDMLKACCKSIDRLSEKKESILENLWTLTHELEEQTKHFQELSHITQTLQEGQNLLEEASKSLNVHIQNFENEDQSQSKLNEIEKKLSLIYQMARKVKIQPHELQEFLEKCQEQKETLEGYQEKIPKLEQNILLAEKKYMTYAKDLSEMRREISRKLATPLTQMLAEIGLEHASIDIHVQYNKHIWKKEGSDEVEILFSANPGRAMFEISKSASGGERTRIWLAMQIVASKNQNTLMIFDEADVGISGETSSMVGKALRKLARNNTVWCITHSAQVATYGHYHWQVVKTHQEDKTSSTLHSLNKEGRINELSRLIGGSLITETTKNHAQALLEEGQGA